MSRTRVRRRRVAAVLVAGVSVLVVSGPALRFAGAPASSTEQVARRTYVVRPGDSLWSIALRVGGRKTDPRVIVDALVEANGVSPGDLVPGETLEIPPTA